MNLAAKGCHLAISDVNEQGLQETANLLADKNVKVTTHIVDVANREQVYQYADDVVKEHGRANIIINNAGVAVGDSIEEVSYEDFEWIVDINFWGVVYGTKAFLPHLKKEPEGHIVNISSINGIIPNPHNGPYCSTKFAVKGFTETLCQEMRGTSVGVTVVHPGGIATDIVRNARVRRHINPNKIARRDWPQTLTKRSSGTPPISRPRRSSPGSRRTSNGSSSAETQNSWTG